MAEPAHILFLIDSFWGGRGGAEGALIRTVKHLPRDRFRCSVITFQADPQGRHANQLDCPYHYFPLTSSYDWNAFQTALRLRDYIRREKVALVHTFFETSDLWGAPVAWLSGCRRIISSRRDMGILRRGKHHLFYKWLAGMYSQVQTVSNEVGAFVVREDGVDPERVVTVYNGIDATRFGPGAVEPVPREELGVCWASHVVLSVGNIRRVKGYGTLVAAAAIVRREFPDACFVIVGNPHEPDFHQQLLRQREELGLERNVVFLGSREDVPALLRTADVFCMPSVSEGLSNALLEAMASELPVVATRVGGNPETVREGVSGHLVASGDAEALAARLIELLGNSERRRAMGLAGRAIVEEQFTLEAMVRELTAHYEALLAK